MKRDNLIEKIVRPAPARVNDPHSWREPLLNGLLIAATLTSIIAFGAYLPLALQSEAVIATIFYAIVCLSLIMLTVLRRLPYTLRSVGLLATIYLAGATSIISTGLMGSGQIFLLVLPLIGSILLGTSGGIAGLVLSVATVGLSGLLLAGEELWFSSAVSFALVSAITTITLTILVQRLEWSLKTGKSAADQMATERAQLEQRVFERTQVLERRLGQIYTAAEISRAISAVLDRQSLLQQVVDLVQHRFELYYVGVFLVDDQQEFAVLQAGTGEAGQKMIAEGHRLKIGGTSMVGWAVAHKEPRIALDVGSESVHFRNPHLPMTLSEMALPLVSGPRVLGAMTIQSGQPDAFDQDDITVLKAIADTLATALENADLFRELETRLEEIRALHAQYLIQAWSEAPRLHGDLSYTYNASLLKEYVDNPAEVEFPVTLRGQHIGKLTVQAAKEQLSTEDLAFIDAVTTEAALALENARLLEENQRRAQQEHLLGEISARAQQYMDLDMVLKTAVQDVRQALNAPKVRIRLSSEHSPTEPTVNKKDGIYESQENPG
ncbi:MAG: GAF domain-containing protein [Anaerolineales bacterium]|jgi:GAF domain-containing protein